PEKGQVSSVDMPRQGAGRDLQVFLDAMKGPTPMSAGLNAQVIHPPLDAALGASEILRYLGTRKNAHCLAQIPFFNLSPWLTGAVGKHSGGLPGLAECLEVPEHCVERWEVALMLRTGALNQAVPRRRGGGRESIRTKEQRKPGEDVRPRPV